MNVLERILEEIEKVKNEYCNGEHSPMFCMGAYSMAIEVKQIIRSHMNEVNNNDWIPVSERMPEPYETVLVSAKMKNDTEYFTCEAIKQTSNMWLLAGVANNIDYEVVAWKPRPEPYCPTEE